MMKSFKWIIALSIFSFSIVSCDKDTQTLENSSETEEIVLQSEVSDEDDEYILGIVIDGVQQGTSDCPVVTHSSDPGTFPNTVTIDFGDACEGPHGQIRSGIIVIDLSGPPQEEGSTKIVSYQDYYIGEVQVTGTWTFVNEGLNDDGQWVHTKTVDNAGRFFPDGSSIQWNATFTRVQVEGSGTDERIDDVFEITGMRYGFDRNGNEFAYVITEALRLEVGCPWITSGIAEITRNGKTVIIDYGDGECDRKATLTFSDGSTKEIRLKHKRFN